MINGRRAHREDDEHDGDHDHDFDHGEGACPMRSAERGARSWGECKTVVGRGSCRAREALPRIGRRIYGTEKAHQRAMLDVMANITERTLISKKPTKIAIIMIMAGSI